jgi:alkyl sulfatase BDS1-like metallo-beta-lactamase superfamily hydrolase
MAEGQWAVAAADYRWAVEILHKLVFAEPGNQAARDLQADAYEQMGYQADGPQWRGIFLTAARELRQGAQPAAFATAGPDTILAMPVHILFDFAAVHVIGEEAAKVDLRIDFTFTDLDQTWTMWVKRGVLNARASGSPKHRSEGISSCAIPQARWPGAGTRPVRIERSCPERPGCLPWHGRGHPG